MSNTTTLTPEEEFQSFMENYVYGSDWPRAVKDEMTKRVWNWFISHLPAAGLSEDDIREEAEKLYPFNFNESPDTVWNRNQKVRREHYIAALTAHPKQQGEEVKEYVNRKLQETKKFLEGDTGSLDMDTDPMQTKSFMRGQQAAFAMVLGVLKSNPTAADQQRWISVEERLPDKVKGLEFSKVVIVAVPKEVVMWGYYDFGLKLWYSTRHDSIPVTHWMPLPTAPGSPETDKK